jgi:hypothetical protein
MEMDVTETACELDLLCRRELLMAKENDAMASAPSAPAIGFTSKALLRMSHSPSLDEGVRARAKSTLVGKPLGARSPFAQARSRDSLSWYRHCAYFGAVEN